MFEKLNFPYVKLFLFSAKLCVITVTVYLYSHYSGKPEEALLDKSLSILNETVQELLLQRLIISSKVKDPR